ARNARRDEQKGTWTLGHDAPGGLDTVHDRHDEIHENHIRPVLGRAAHGLGAIHGHPRHSVAGHADHKPPQHFAGQGQVVDNADAHGHAVQSRLSALHVFVAEFARIPLSLPRNSGEFRYEYRHSALVSKNKSYTAVPIRSWTARRKVSSWKLLLVR